MESITAEVHHGVVVAGTTIEFHGYFGVDLEVKAKTPKLRAPSC